jgi:hypothetical protein
MVCYNISAEKSSDTEVLHLTDRVNEAQRRKVTHIQLYGELVGSTISETKVS